MEITANAPVVSRQEMLILAPIETIWDFQTDIAAWPSWQPSVVRVKAPRTLEVGSVFIWETQGTEITSTVQEIEAPRRIVWTGPATGMQAIHKWTFTQMDDGVMVRTEESFDGPGVEANKASLQKMLDASLVEWLQNL